MDLAREMNDFLGNVEQALAASLVDDPSATHQQGDILMEAGRHLCLGEGKRVRPRLVRLFAGAVRAPSAPLVDLAVASELIHSASLLHDDVVDGGMFRRGRPTVNAVRGNIVAVMSGDLLLCTALGSLARIDPALCPDAIALVAEMTRAAIAEVEARGNLSLPLEQLRFIQEGKTGSLFGWCGVAAAHLAGQPEARRRFDLFGRHLGVAFQIADDIRDVTGAEKGKPQYADLLSRTPSMPVLLAVSRDEGLRRRIKDAWAFTSIAPEKVRELGLTVIATGALDEAVERMHVEIDAAIAALGPWASEPAAAELISWAHQLAASVQGQARKTA
ncbi:MAG: polyprenyl synthetase family protein [Myxococcaceae bacterium]|nr:polyprenyl synthetase family protein [Myxococcaceae bacterium]MCI0669184.1 polyprenyl synthetase family protein [Myxococcaceae bacterium]